MGTSIVRYREKNQICWGVVRENKVIPLGVHMESLAEFLLEGVHLVKNVESYDCQALMLEDLHILSPITKPANIICQGGNYGVHRSESGLSADRAAYNSLFLKASSSLCGANDKIINPAHVKLLDYEIELGLVIGKAINKPVEITDENLHEYVAGLVITNDISAREIQILQKQWFKGKSYRTFCPTGPFLYLLDKEDVLQIHDLNLKCWVNGELRQSVNTSQLLYKPSETLTELTEIMDLSPGDLVLTGTPGGVAFKGIGDVMQKIMSPAVSDQDKMNLLLESQQGNPYLQDGDIIRCEISSSDNKIHLGVQQNTVVFS